MKCLLPVACVLAAAFLAGCDTGSDDGSADLERGERFLAEGNARAALGALAKAVEKCPTNAVANLRLALVAVEAGEKAQSLAAARAAVEADSSSAEARLALAQAEWLNRNATAAIEDFTFVANAKELPAALRSLAWSSRAVVEIEANAFDEARISLFKALRLDLRNASAWYHLGVLSRDTWGFEAPATMQFTMFSRLAPAADARTRTVVEKTLPALREAIAARNANVRNASRRNPGAAAKLIAEADALMAKKAVKGARDKYEKALATDPLSGAAALGFARAQRATDKSENAVTRVLDAYRTVIDQRSDDVKTYLEAAQFALERRRYAAAVSVLNRAIAQNHESVAALRLYVDALQRKGDAKTARLYRDYLAWSDR